MFPSPLSVPAAIAKDRLADIQPDKEESNKPEGSNIPEAPATLTTVDKVSHLSIAVTFLNIKYISGGHAKCCRATGQTSTHWVP